MLVQVEFSLHKNPFHQVQIFPVMLCFSTYFTCVLLLSPPSQTSSWISHLSFQMAFAAIWSLNFELGSSGEWEIS